MMILTLRTDKDEAEFGLYSGQEKLTSEKWQAGRTLSDTIFNKLSDLLNKSSKELEDLEGIVVFKGPGSFTGLRIGLSVANALAFGLDIPIVSTGGSDWATSGIEKLSRGENAYLALPHYGAPVHITKPRK